MKSLDQLTSDYNAVEVPVGLSHGLGEYNPDVVQWEFFYDLMDALGLLGIEQGDHGSYFDVRTRMLVPVHGRSFSAHSDDYLTELQLGDAQTLATTLRTRSQFNYEVVHFAKIPLQDRTLQYLGQLAIDL